MALFSRKSAAKSRPVPPVVVDPARVATDARAAGPSAAPGADDQRVLQIGTDLLDRARKHAAGVLSAKFYSEKLMEWSMKDHDFKVQMFRFVDAFPVLTTPEMVHDHLVDYLTQPGVKVPGALEIGLKAGGMAKGLMASTISGQIKSMAGRFIAGTDAASALPRLKDLWKDGIAFSVDLLGEACVSDEEAAAYAEKYRDLITNLPAQVASWAADERLERDHLGGIPRTNVSIKISSLSARCDPIDTEGAIRVLVRNLTPLLEAARERGVLINFDMEQDSLKDLTLDLFMRCCEAVDFQAGLAMQAYLKSGPDDARRLAEWAKRTGRVVTVRLVKGAYWDYETIHAEQQGWPCPVWPEKWMTDRCFEQMTDILLDASPRGGPGGPALRAGLPTSSTPSAASTGTPDAGSINEASRTGRKPGSESRPISLGPTRLDPGSGGIKLALGSHNVRSIAYALAGLEKRSLPPQAIELQMLHGMADQLKHAAAELGLRVREYVPVGEMIPGMAYLVRRLLENTSNESWLKAGFLDGADPAELLRPPGPKRATPPGEAAAPWTNGVVPSHAMADGSLPNTPASGEKPDLSAIGPERHAMSPAVPGVGDSRPFFNEPLRNFSKKAQARPSRRALRNAMVPQVANDRTPEQAAEMVARAAAAFPAWARHQPTRPGPRPDPGRRRDASPRDELSGVIIKENAKAGRDADADVAEAIDFCDYYARMAPALFDRRRVGRFIGELDQTLYQPRGVAVVISPWNFPLAIACGMVTAALVTGNTAILKPAEQTPGIAKILCEILWRALDAALADPSVASSPTSARSRSVASTDVLHFCPAPGETTGAALVRDPRIALVAFTGSRDVGLDILNAAAPPSPFSSSSLGHSVTPSLSHLKHVVCEMGGKNAIIIDSSADLDEAVLGSRQSAFGFQGQKCSACSRIIVVDPDGPKGPHISTFTRRFVEATRSLAIGDPAKPGTDVGPVIEDAAATKIADYIETAKREGCTLELDGGLPTDDPFVASSLRRFVAPTVFSAVQPHHTIWKEEIFGPVVAIAHAATFDDALRLANDHPYKLTGGVFTRKPAHIERAKRAFRVGNLYINRGCTGALVARQPFGGFGMSGGGTKAGGADYLLHFVEPRAICENTMRRGFAPEL
ncbi:MAG: proline dehydrogenase family protein [Phycisphaerales bacterium]